MTLPTANVTLDECSSTNDLARQLGEAGLPHGTWISAKRQIAGRGRLGRQWSSAEGNLHLSILVRDAGPRSQWSWIPLAAGVGAAQALRRLDPRLEVEVKWPNDLWIRGRKVGGILCEAVSSPTGAFVVIGIGVNCLQVPPDLDQPAASLSSEALMGGEGGAISPDRVRDPLREGILAAIAGLAQRGPGFVARGYQEHAALKPGLPVEWTQADASRSGQVLHLGESGELVVRADDDGSTVRLFAEDVKIRPARRASGGSPA